VDDDEGILALVDLHLRNAGYEVSIAEDAVVAGRMFLESRPDLLIVDVDMPYMNGLEFVAALSADNTIPYVSVIFMTAHEDFIERAKALRAACLSKPFSVGQLLEVVERSLSPVLDQPSSDVRYTSNPRRVLIVEDNLDSVRAIAALVRDMGHKIQYAINGFAALTLAQQFKPEIVLLDLGLPGMDGFEVCGRLQHEPGLPRPRIIAVTAYGRDEHRARARAAGCETYLVKPVNPQTLFEVLESPPPAASR
jgi:CheY-like chemotaxis protein